MESKLEEKAIVIVGAGPAGSTLSMYLSKKKVPHVLLDASSFPRDKICGDGLTVEVLRAMHELGLAQKYDGLKDIILPSYGFKIVTPKGKVVHFKQEPEQSKYAPYYTSKRKDFDNFLIENLDLETCDFRPESKVISIKKQKDYSLLTVSNEGKEYVIKCKIVIGADGVRSIVKSYFHEEGLKKDTKHNYAALRTYFKNVELDHKYNELELYFFKNLLPCYFWIFPLPNGEANVGIGMNSKDVMHRKVNLKKEILKIIETHPELKKRFKNAEQLTKVEGWSIPVNTQRTKLFGEGYILHGDAATLAESLTGKGIGISMEASKLLSHYLAIAFEKDDFSINQFEAYQQDLYKQHGAHWDGLDKMTKFFRVPWLVESFPFIYKLLGAEKRLLADNLRWTDLD